MKLQIQMIPSEHEISHNGCEVRIVEEYKNHYRIVFVKHAENCKYKNHSHRQDYHKEWVVPAGRLGTLIYG